MYFYQHCFIYLPSDSTVSEEAGIEPRTVATLALTLRRSKHKARSQSDALTTRLDPIHNFSPPKNYKKNISLGEDDGRVSLRTLAAQAQE
jgi:hypothetical protein